MCRLWTGAHPTAIKCWLAHGGACTGSPAAVCMSEQQHGLDVNFCVLFFYIYASMRQYKWVSECWGGDWYDICTVCLDCSLPAWPCIDFNIDHQSVHHFWLEGIFWGVQVVWSGMGIIDFFSIKWLKLVCINANSIFVKVDIMNNIYFF